MYMCLCVCSILCELRYVCVSELCVNTNLLRSHATLVTVLYVQLYVHVMPHLETCQRSVPRKHKALSL